MAQSLVRHGWIPPAGELHVTKTTHGNHHEVFSSPTEISVSCLPETVDARELRRLLHLTVKSRNIREDGTVEYGVFDSNNNALNSETMEWEYEPRPSEREGEWLAKHRFTFEEAMRHAAKIAPTLSYNQFNVKNSLEILAITDLEARNTYIQNLSQEFFAQRHAERES